MRKIKSGFFIFLSVLFLIISLRGIVFAEFDYSKYLAPQAWRAIEESQGPFFIFTPTFSEPEKSYLQALVIDEKNALILTTAHCTSDYPAVAASQKTIYLFLYKGTVFTAQLKYLDKSLDLAIFKLSVPEENPPSLKAVAFTEEIRPFTEYYAFGNDLLFDAENMTIEVYSSFPFKANLVSKFGESIERFGVEQTCEFLTFDKTVKEGFSGSGVFNNKGEAIGIIKSLQGGYSYAIGARTIVSFIEEYRAHQAQKPQKADK